MQLLMPMAGDGTRFSKAGWVVPKPLIPIDGVPMWARAVDDVLRSFPVSRMAFCARPGVVENVGRWGVSVPALTRGAAETTLLAEARFDPDGDLLIVNCDQHIEFESGTIPDAEVGIFTFRSNFESKWSYFDEETGQIEEKPEHPKTDLATCGAYWFRTARSYFDAARAMIAADYRVRGEFYVAPVINFIEGRKVSIPVREFRSYGTHEDLVGAV